MPTSVWLSVHSCLCCTVSLIMNNTSPASASFVNDQAQTSKAQMRQFSHSNNFTPFYEELLLFSTPARPGIPLKNEQDSSSEAKDKSLSKADLLHLLVKNLLHLRQL